MYGIVVVAAIGVAAILGKAKGLVEDGIKVSENLGILFKNLMFSMALVYVTSFIAATIPNEWLTKTGLVILAMTGVILGVPGVLGLLIGGLATGFVLAVFMANSGGAWDNAKKYVEEGNFGGKGSDNHKATVVGDTVGDPFKDTSGPSLNILIKLMSMVSIVMAGLTVTCHLL
jgi:hypothetical protein